MVPSANTKNGPYHGDAGRHSKAHVASTELQGRVTASHHRVPFPDGANILSRVGRVGYDAV
jgi:hypothetical protein